MRLPFWLVSITWKRWPSASLKESCAPGCGRSRRQIARVPSGQAESSTSSSATQAPSRGPPSLSSAGSQASCRTARHAAHTRSDSSNPTVWAMKRETPREVLGRTAPPAGMQDLARACGHGEQGVVAPHVGVAEPAPPAFLRP